MSLVFLSSLSEVTCLLGAVRLEPRLATPTELFAFLWCRTVKAAILTFGILVEAEGVDDDVSVCVLVATASILVDDESEHECGYHAYSLELRHHFLYGGTRVTV